MKRSEILNHMVETICLEDDSVEGVEEAASKIMDYLEHFQLLQNVEPDEKPKKKVTLYTWERFYNNVFSGYSRNAIECEKSPGPEYTKVPGLKRVIEVDDDTK